ncbi:MAG: hypothetical protein AB7S86_17845 [Hydrogenophaga sp.]|uniref:RIFT barrel domain-containing protein n=1 Tax=Hydrogenophaga sp. TaxID=1904254 RepID=UPI003D1448A8
MEVASGSTQTSVPVTFGQPFKAGDLLATQGLSATDSNGAAVPLQMDEISSHVDGSVRFAVLSARVSNLQANQPRLINLFAAGKSVSAPVVPADPAWNIELEATVYDSSGNATTLIAQPQAQLKAQIASGAGKRLSGAVAAEYTVVTPFKNKATNAVHPHLVARLHTRLYEGGARIRTDAVLENTRTFVAAPGNITYDLKIKRDGVVIHSQPKFTHYHHARWHKVLWTGGSAPNFRLRHHMPYFLASRATWNYNLALSVPQSVLQSEAQQLASAKTGPMEPAFLETYFPTTGARSDIGPVPRVTALYLITQDDRVRANMFANADAAAGVPIHYRDENTDQPLDVETYPNVSVRYDISVPKIPSASGSTIWEADTAHQGSFAYIPYLITGDAFYLDEMAFWASWNIAFSNPSSRGYASGWIKPNEARGQAWSLRSIHEIARALPDSHAMKGSFQRKLANNLTWYVNNYPAASAGSRSPLGAFTGDDKTEAAPWQNDFMTLVMAQIAEDGNNASAKTFLNWITQFTVGRFTNESNGFCPTKAPGSWWKIQDSSGKFLTSWGALYAANYGSVGTNCGSVPVDNGYPDLAEGQAAMARAMLAAATSAGIPGASASYTWWKSKTPKMDAAFTSDPTWAIVPR